MIRYHEKSPEELAAIPSRDLLDHPLIQEILKQLDEKEKESQRIHEELKQKE